LVLVPIPITEKFADDSSWVPVSYWLEVCWKGFRICHLLSGFVVDTGTALGKISVEETVETMKSASMLKGLMLVDDGHNDDDDDNDSLRSAAVMRSSPLGSGSFVWQADASVEVETNATSSRQHDHHHPATATSFAPDTLKQAYGSLFASDDFSTADTLLFSDDNEEDDDDDSDNDAIQVCVQCV
jgi:hypothetical protein